MNKKDLINYIAENHDLTATNSKEIVNSFISFIQDNIKKDVVSLQGIGSFTSVKRKARVGRNPSTGEEIKIKARNAVKFTPSSILKEVCNGKKSVSTKKTTKKKKAKKK